MSEQLVPLFYFLLLAALIPVLLGLYGLRRHSAPGITEFGMLMLAVAWWILTSALEKAMPTIPTRVTWSKFQYIGIVSTAVFWFLFAVRFTRRDALITPFVSGALWIIPAITVVIAFTNEFHHLLWINIIPANGDPGGLLVYVHGPWFWVQASYAYILYITGTLVLVWAIVRFPQIYRSQAASLALAGAIPILGNVLYLANLIPVHGLDITPLSFILSGLIAAWSIFRFRIFDLTPVAREAVIENMWDGVLVLDTQDYLADINPRARQMLGLGKQKFIGQPVQNALAGWPALLRLLQATASDSRPREIHSSKGSLLALEVSLTELKDWRGKPIGRLVVLRDVSERKQAESLRDTLVHTIVHDLRNPLNNIIASLDLMDVGLERVTQPDGEDDNQDECLTLRTTAQASANRMISLVNSILDISKMESGQMALERQVVNLNQLIADVIHLQIPLASLNNVSVEEQIPAELPPVMVDPSLIRRVLQNLLDNAIRFAPKKSSISLKVDALPDQSILQFSVQDKGPGISPELQAHIFEKFTTGKEQRGSGLGLAFCRLAVEAHKGRIWVESDSERGTTFSFTLPTQ